MKKAIIYLVMFFAIQAICSFVVMGVWYLVKGVMPGEGGAFLVITSLLFSIVTMLLFGWRRWTPVNGNYLKTRPWSVLFWAGMAALGFLLPSDWFQEQIPELPNQLKDSFNSIVNTPGGYLALAILVPVAEEFVFRGAILRVLLKSFGADNSLKGVWIAIALSALLFALAHMNPAQMPHAFVVGLLLGWFYWRTGSILPGVVYHVVNNTASYVMMRLYPNLEDLTLTDFFGSEANVLKALGFSVLIFLPAIYQLHLRMKRK